MKIILDAGHGVTTPGKRSPDSTLREYKYCREIMNKVKKELEDKGYTVYTTVTDDKDIPLNDRCKYVNKLISQNKQDKFLLVSIHCNAAGDGSKWLNAKGWCVFVSNNASTNSKLLATNIATEAIKNKLNIRKQYSNILYWTQNLAICRDTNCPAVLTENLFQDNKEDVKYLLSTDGKETITKLHVNGIINYINVINKK